MPPLLCGSPCILDQSFPKNDETLAKVVQALGKLEELVGDDTVHLILVDSFKEFLLDFDWDMRGRQYPILRTIHFLLSQWFLQPHTRLVIINTEGEINKNLHPLPNGVQNSGWAIHWAEEMARLLSFHDRSCFPNFCIGVICEEGFTSDRLNTWDNPSGNRVFPLVGPNQISSSLEDAYDWNVPENISKHQITLQMAIANLNILGASKIDKPKRDSHYKVHFPGRRPWTLDENVSPIPDDFIKELIPITKLPISVIKTVLVHGYMPEHNILKIQR